MAFGLKYTSTFKQIKPYSTSGEWQLKIYLEGYGGGVSEFKTTPNSIQKRRDGDIKGIMLPTTLQFGIYNQNEGQFNEFATASWGDYKVELIFDPNGTPVVDYIGYNQTEIYTEPFEQKPYPTMLKFTCGLSHLRYVRWDNSGTLYSDQKSLIEILRLATNKLPDGLAIREFINVYENNQNSTTTDSTLNQTYLDSELFKKITKAEGQAIEQNAFMCYQVIEEILKSFRCHIYQAEGKWYIIRKQEYKDTTMYWREFNPRVGSESTITVDNTGNLTTNKRTVTNANTATTDIIFPAADGEKESFPPLNRVQVSYKQQNLDFQSNNLMRNGDFNDVTLAAGATTHNGLPTYYTEGSGLDTTTYFAMTAVNELPDSRLFQFNPSSYKTASAIDTTKYLQYQKLTIPIAINDQIQIQFNAFVWVENTTTSGGSASTYNSYISNDASMIFEMQVKFGTYYLGGDATTGYSWSTTAGRCKLEINGFGSVASGSNWFNGVFFISQLMPTLPETGIRDMQVRIYQPYHDVDVWSLSDADNTASVQAIAVTDYEILYLPSGLEPVEEQTLYADIFEDENYEEIEVIVGDSDNTISQGALKLASALNTDLWTRRGVIENLPILRILIESMADDFGGFGEIVNGKLIGEFDSWNSIEMTVGAVTSEYQIQSYTQMMETNEWAVSLFKLQDFNPTITLVDSVTNTPRTTETTTDEPLVGNPVARVLVSPTSVVGQSSNTSGNTINLSKF